MGKKVVLVGPDRQARREVIKGTPLEAQLRAAGWREPRAATPPAAGQGSETARQAREALATLPAEEWVRDWGRVLCASLDEVENLRDVESKRAVAAANAMLAGIEAVKAMTQACSTWMLRVGWQAGRSVLEPTIERQASAEDLVRLLLEISATYRRKADIFLSEAGEPNGFDSRLVSGDPVARSRASAFLDQLGREFPADLPGGRQIQESIQRVRSMFLGGSNVPVAEGEEEPS